MMRVNEGPYNRTTALWHVRDYVDTYGWSGAKRGRIVKIEKFAVVHAEVWVQFEGEDKPRVVDPDQLKHRKVT